MAVKSTTTRVKRKKRVAELRTCLQKITLIDFGVGNSAFRFVSKRQVELQQQQQQFAT